jgi:hypothetical protein
MEVLAKANEKQSGWMVGAQNSREKKHQAQKECKQAFLARFRGYGLFAVMDACVCMHKP